MKNGCDVVHEKNNIYKTRIARKRVHEVLNENTRQIHKFPFVRDFVVFELYCNKMGIEHSRVDVLWDTLNTVQVYEVSSNLIRQQIQSLMKVTHGNRNHLNQLKTLRLCSLCCQFEISVTSKTVCWKWTCLGGLRL
jgi:hypothetical protein